ncbi:VOC family protein [bacterium]|nr:MAG: VOC family protein [bacterium]
MLLHHVGIFNKDENQAVTFYHDFLGMEKVREYLVTPELSRQLFSVARETRVVTFARGDVKVEIFLSTEFDLPAPNIPHFCLHLENFSEILETARTSGIEVITGKKDDKTVYFLKDFSGNMIEIKSA